MIVTTLMPSAEVSTFLYRQCMTFLYDDDLCIISSVEVGVMETPSGRRSHKMEQTQT